MRQIAASDGEVGRANLNGKQSFVPAAQELWNSWEIHCLIVASLVLQVLLFLLAGMRRRSASGVLRTVLWLAYLSADSVAIFVLGHLAVHASEPGHQLLSFWAPFLLVHLGGQDTITAFSRQDNELWRRHLLSLVTQASVAAYVVATASWPDHRLRAAMALLFVSGFFKYAERVCCLFLMSTVRLSGAKNRLAATVEDLQAKQGQKASAEGAAKRAKKTLAAMSRGSTGAPIMSAFGAFETETLIQCVDAPLNKVESILAANQLPGMLKEFLSDENRHRGYEYVEASLVRAYHLLYTKLLIRQYWYQIYAELFADGEDIIVICMGLPFLLYPIFQLFSAPIALLLFTVAEKGDQGQLHAASSADVTVSYILLVGAIVLDVSSVTMFLLSRYFTLRPALWSRKQWSQEVAQYSMIKRHAAVQETAVSMASIRLRVGKRLGDWAVRLLEVTSTPITQARTSIKKSILDSLLRSGTRKEWDIASTRGKRALHHRAMVDKPALNGSISDDVDFPTSLLIWHIATDICYHPTSTDDSDDKQMCRELSNYIMYLVFKCGVMLTDNSQLLHDNAHDEIREVLSSSSDHRDIREMFSSSHRQQVSLGEEDAFKKIFSATKEQEDLSKIFSAKKKEEQHKDDSNFCFVDRNDSKVEPKDHHQVPANDDDSSHMQKLLQSANDLQSPLLPRACAVAEELIGIENETERWELIAEVWSEMLFYTAPRCGGAFHYEHLSTGGEFVTHVLMLMYLLGPFLPAPGA